MKCMYFTTYLPSTKMQSWVNEKQGLTSELVFICKEHKKTWLSILNILSLLSSSPQLGLHQAKGKPKAVLPKEVFNEEMNFSLSEQVQHRPTYLSAFDY